MICGYLQFQPRFCDVDANINKIFSLIEKQTKFDFLVLPELANSGYVFKNLKELETISEEIPGGYFVSKLEELANEKNAYLVCGVSEKKGSIFFNSSVLVGPEGYISTYRKIHLFDREKMFFKSGNKPLQIFEINGVNVGMLICFDWIFPEATRVLALKGMHLLAHSANLVLPYSQTAMLARSIENKIFTITANRIGTEINEDIELTFTGESQITSPNMEVLKKASRDKEEIAYAQLDISKARDKWLNERNHLFQDRRTEYYKRLIEK